MKIVIIDGHLVLTLDSGVSSLISVMVLVLLVSRTDRGSLICLYCGARTKLDFLPLSQQERIPPKRNKALIDGALCPGPQASRHLSMIHSRPATLPFVNLNETI